MNEETLTKEFHIGDIISVITDRLVSPNHIDGVYEILNWMTGDNLYTHQLPRAGRECAPALRAQFPELARVEVPQDVRSHATLGAWLNTLERQFGATRAVKPLAPGEHTVIDPITEMNAMRPDVPIIVVGVELEQS